MSKIIFTKRPDGRNFTCTNRAEFMKKVISSAEVETLANYASVKNSSADDEPKSTVFTVVPKSNLFYAVHEGDIILALAVKESGCIKILFNDGTVRGQRVYIEDGDVMFTTAEEAKNYVMEQQTASQTANDDTEDEVSDAVKLVGTLLGDIFKTIGIDVRINGKSLCDDEDEPEETDETPDAPGDDDTKLQMLIRMRDKYRKLAEDYDKQIKEEYGLLDFE